MTGQDWQSDSGDHDHISYFRAIQTCLALERSLLLEYNFSPCLLYVARDMWRPEAAR